MRAEIHSFMACLLALLACSGALQTKSTPAKPLPQDPAATQRDQSTEKQSPASDPLREAPEPSPRLAERIEGWIKDLASPRFEVREAATESLAENCDDAVRALQRAYLATRDLEVQMRIERLVHAYFMNVKVFSRNAFLGISMEPIRLTHAMDGRVPQEGDGIIIGSIVPGTAAEQAGLRRGDVIILLDGEPVHGSSSIGDNRSFSEVLRNKGVGTEILLTVLRNADTVEIQVTLGARPREYYRSLEAPGFAEQQRKAREQFRSWWKESFAVPQPSGTSPSDAESPRK